MIKVPFGCVYQKLANVTPTLHYLLRVFPEYLKQLYSKLTNIGMLEITYVILFET